MSMYARRTCGLLRRCQRWTSTAVDPSRLPLDGVRVLDMTRVLAGPYCTQILGDLGAEVIKIEHPTRGDDTRAWGPPYAASKDGTTGESAYFLGVNRNKKSVGLSFKDPRGQKVLHALAVQSDVLVENYLPGTLAKYGLSYDHLSKVNPSLIYASITGYGQTGPYRDRAGYDVMVEAEMGLMHITGEPNRPPVKVGVAVTDITTGLYASNSIMAGLIARGRTGRGQYIDVALSDCQVAALANIASSALISGQPDSGRHGTAHPSIVPYESFPTADGNILLGGGNDRLYAILCAKIEKPEWVLDERFLTNALRVKHRKALVPMIAEETQRRTTHEWLKILEGRWVPLTTVARIMLTSLSGVPYAAVNDIQSTLSHKHVLARDMIKNITHETCGDIKLVNTPVKYSYSKPGIRSPPPTLGQHTEEVMRTVLGMDAAEIHRMRIAGVVGFGELSVEVGSGS